MPGEPPVVRTILAAIDAEIARLQEARQLLTGGKSQAARRTGQGKHTLSREARARISVAQKKRWAAIKKAARKAAVVV